MKRALVVGCRGQDGRLLMAKLQRDGIEAAGVGRGDCDWSDRSQAAELLGSFRPDEIYYLPAYHHSSEDRIAEDDGELFRRSYEVHVTGLIHCLEAIREGAPQRVFYAASSHIFGRPTEPLQNEHSALAPTNIYGITKAAGVHCCRYYRAARQLFVSVGILYNHESSYRRDSFLSQKIARAARSIRAGGGDQLVLGDLSARVDWGYAPDYVDAMTRILALPEPDDFIVATGETQSVQDFVQIAFESAGLDWRRHVAENSALLTKRTPPLCGDARKLRERTGWRPTVDFREMVARMVTPPDGFTPPSGGSAHPPA